MALEATARGPTEADNRADPRVQVATNGTDPRIHSAPASVAELRERLAARISHLRTARGLDSDDRPKSRAEIIERREKRRKDSDDRKQSVKDKKAKGSGGPTAKVGLLDSIAAVAKTPTPSSNGKSADSLVDSVSFGNVDFGATALDLQRRPQKLDAKTALSKLEAKNRKLATIAEKDADKFEVIKEKEAWSKIQKLAGGEKVKDDVKLLKKTIKKLEKKKERSKKDWDARLYTQHKGKSDKQQKRNDNLAQRKDDKIVRDHVILCLIFFWTNALSLKSLRTSLARTRRNRPNPRKAAKASNTTIKLTFEFTNSYITD